MRPRLYHLIVVFLLIQTLLMTRGLSWGWETHRYINEHAVEYLPPEMAFFKAQQQFLTEHAADPDKSKNRPGYWHYIDIDNYPEYFTGTLPTDLNALLKLYDYKTVTGNGILPWAIGYEMDSLRTLMSDGQWDMAWQAAADLGHYVADFHQPLHLTANYNGQLSGNKGIHSRYETGMINPRLAQLALPTGHAVYLDDVNQTVFQYVHDIYPGVTQILSADSAATLQDPSQDSLYNAIMWGDLDSLTNAAVDSAILDLASVWYTTWINAGSPYPTGFDATSASEDGVELRIKQQHGLFFYTGLRIQYTLPKTCEVEIGVYDARGQRVRHMADKDSATAGKHTLKWNYKSDSGTPVSDGTYFVRLSAGTVALAAKVDYRK